jgi:hypothetical protein
MSSPCCSSGRQSLFLCSHLLIFLLGFDLLFLVFLLLYALVHDVKIREFLVTVNQFLRLGLRLFLLDHLRQWGARFVELEVVDTMEGTSGGEREGGRRGRGLREAAGSGRGGS